MTYTDRQIRDAKVNYNSMLVFKTLSNYDVETIGRNTAEQRMKFDNDLVSEIKNGNKDLEREWKLFFLRQEVLADQKQNEKKEKLAKNKAASADVLSEVKRLRKLGDFGKWLNTSGNSFRKQHFNKKYTQEAVNGFLQTL
jgi:hypothetical protein